MKKLVFGILAHVDSGKTTLSEGLLYTSGSIRSMGRVDHGDAFLDNFDIERQRGITIFSKQAVLETEEMSAVLLDTPGHVDFSTETERTLDVLDYAILVINGSDGVQAHTETLWRLLKDRGIPVFLFINKMDLAPGSQSRILSQLKERFGGGFVSFSQESYARDEEISLLSDSLLEVFLEKESLESRDIASLILKRSLYPCFFGSALKMQGVEEFLRGLEIYTLEPSYPDEFGARIFKIARDDRDERLTYMKITGGTLKVRDSLDIEGESQKVSGIRIYSGARFTAVQQCSRGEVCAVTGLSDTYPGMGLGYEKEGVRAQLEPVLTYRLIYPENLDPHTVMGYMKKLMEEDPQLKAEWDSRLSEIHVSLMGRVQQEVLAQLCRDRFNMEVSFDSGSILYKETITEPVEGIGHYEPLRHYAEVRLLLQPGERGSGLVFDSSCSTDKLDLNWQRLVLTHLAEKTHLGVLTGSPITDMKITLTAGRSHLKHTEGGDFRQATYRAVRQGLKRAKSVLLEPWYSFEIETPQNLIGRVMADVQKMSGTFDPPEVMGDKSRLSGTAPVSEMKDYAEELTAFTSGSGRISLRMAGYFPCHNEQEVIDKIGYDSDRDTENPCDSVFCDHGAGFVVPWYKVPSMAHTESPLKIRQNKVDLSEEKPRGAGTVLRPFSREEEELLAQIFKRTYGANIKRDTFTPVRKSTPEPSLPGKDPIYVPARGDEYLLVDGYNIIFAWDELKRIAESDLDGARQALLDILVNYRGYKGINVILVFDAYKVKGGTEKVEQINGVYVVYTKEKETADMYIERTTYDIARRHRVRVATSDNLEQMIILGHGAVRMPASELLAEVGEINGRIRQILDDNLERTKIGQKLILNDKNI